MGELDDKGTNAIRIELLGDRGAADRVGVVAACRQNLVLCTSLKLAALFQAVCCKLIQVRPNAVRLQSTQS